jgi:hypothetical protein
MKFKEFVDKYKDYYLVDGLMYLSFIIMIILMFVFLVSTCVSQLNHRNTLPTDFG